MGWNLQCYIPSFFEIGPPVPEKKILKGFYHIGAWRPSWSCDKHHVIRFSFPCTRKLSYKVWFRSAQKFLRKSSTVVSKKIQFECVYVHDLGPRSRNDLDLQYSHIFIYSIRCLLLLTFRSLAAIVFEKIHCFHSRSLQGHNLNIL